MVRAAPLRQTDQEVFPLILAGLCNHLSVFLSLANQEDFRV